MKIRTDFVTNSSSSNFTVSLRLQFDGKKVITLDYSSTEGDLDYDSHNFKKTTLNSTYRIAASFGNIVEQRRDIKRLTRILEQICNQDGRVQVEKIAKAKQLTGAAIKLKSSVYGEYSYNGDTSRMLGVDHLSGSIAERMDELRNKGLQNYTDDALETIILYDDADSDQDFQGEGKKKKINYNPDTISKTIVSWMNSEGEIETKISYGSSLGAAGNLTKYDNAIIPKEGELLGLDLYIDNAKKKLEKLRNPQYFSEIVEKNKIILQDTARNHPDIPITEAAMSLMQFDNIDLFDDIEFEDKHFCFTGVDFTDDYGEDAFSEVELHGGIKHSSFVRVADYLVINLQSHFPVAVFQDWIEAIERRANQNPIKIITIEQLWLALTDPEKPQLYTPETLIIKKERDKKKLEEERAAKRRKEEEDKLARKAEREAAKKAKEEALLETRERREKEKADYAQARMIANQAAQDKKEEIRKLKEAAKQEEQRIAKEARAKKQAALEEARANATILYSPGQEPERIHNRIQTLLSKLDEAYPDHVIFNLGKDHKKWGETITELYRQLGYADNRSFLEAYGFTMDESRAKNGRPSSLDPEAVIGELRKRYPNGAGNIKLDELKAANPDLPLKTLSNRASELLGMPLTKYLRQIGILG